MNNISKGLAVAKKFNIKVKFVGNLKLENDDYEVRGRWTKGKEILINEKLATNYTVLHEIGHVLNGYMCCREHCEYAAHGAAIALAKAFDIRLHPQAKREVDCYAGWTNMKHCPAVEENKKWEKK